MLPATGEDMPLFVGNEVQSWHSSDICHTKGPKDQIIEDCQALARIQKHLALSGWQKFFQFLVQAMYTKVTSCP